MRASKMTIITGLKFTEVDTSDCDFVRARSFNLGWTNRFPRIPLLKDAEPPEELVAYTDYYIQGRRVRTPNGKEVFLGNAPEVEEFLGLQFDLFENLKKEKEDALFKLSESQQAVEQLRGMSFLRRLKFLFTGELV